MTTTSQEAHFAIDRMREVTSFVSIQGNIGSGKSTCMKALRRYIERNRLSAIDNYYDHDPDVRDLFLIIDEPVAEWSQPLYHSANIFGLSDDVSSDFLSVRESTAIQLLILVLLVLLSRDLVGPEWVYLLVIPFIIVVTRLVYRIQRLVGSPLEKRSLLDLFYHAFEKKRIINDYAFTFQVAAFTSRLKNVIRQLSLIPLPREGEEAPRIHIIAERSLRTDRLFFNNLYENGSVRQADWLTYVDFHETICGHLLQKEDLMIHLPTSPEKCYTRVYERKRDAEVKNGITLEYLRSLDVAHDKMITYFEQQHPCRVITLDFEQDMVPPQIDALIEELMSKTLKEKLQS